MGAVREADDASIYWRFTALDRLMPMPFAIVSAATAWLAPDRLLTLLSCVALLVANLGLSVVTRTRYRKGASERELQHWIGPARAALLAVGIPFVAWVGNGSDGAWSLAVIMSCLLPFLFPQRLPGVLAATLIGTVTSLVYWLGGSSFNEALSTVAATLSVSLIAGETVHTLQSLVTRVRAAEAAKSEFLANVSHEIRTPMNGILGTLELISDSQDSQDQQQLARIGYRSARGLLTIINDVLDFSKIEAGKMRIHSAPFGVDAFVSDMRAEFVAAAREHGTTFIVEIDPNFPEALVGDVTRVAQIVRNFLSNALKFSRKRSVTLRLCLEADAEGNDWQVFEVIDTGIGMTPDQLSRVFQKFEQAESHTTKKFGGTGLGLAISKNLAEKLGGTIGADSRQGEGSRFWVRLNLPIHAGSLEAISSHIPVSIRHFNEEILRPAANPTSTQTEASLAIPKPAASPADALGLRVLVVDDNKTNRLVAARLLKTIGCDALMVSSGQEAIDACETQVFDAVLMDCQMPEMDGFEATQKIHALANLAALPIIALTASALVENQERCAAAGMTGFLSKPVGKADLRDVLSHAVAATGSGYGTSDAPRNKAECS